MKQVNLKEILKRHIGEYVNSPVSPNVLLAMQEACNQAIDLCAENAKIELMRVNEDYRCEEVSTHSYNKGKHSNVLSISKESIRNTKKQII